MTIIYLQGLCTDSIIHSVSSEYRRIVKGDPQKLRQIRERLGKSQAELGELLGVAGNTVARWERGLLIPPRIAELAAEYLLLTHKKGGRR